MQFLESRRLLAAALCGSLRVNQPQVTAIASLLGPFQAALATRALEGLTSCSHISPLTAYGTTNCGQAYSTASRSSLSSSIGYRIAASYSGKNNRFDPEFDILDYNPFSQLRVKFKDLNVTERKQRRPRSGQDAFFISKIGETGSVAFGIADGVGGWTESGVDPADFSHGLCEYMAAEAYGHGKSGACTLQAKDLLKEGYQQVVVDDWITAGGSTACVAIGRSDGLLNVSNLGDSGFIQLRLNAVHHCSEPQTHAFNTPYQLSVIPPYILARTRAFGGRLLQDKPDDSHVSSHTVRHGDILIFASDGVWDNLSPQDILKIVSRRMISLSAWQRSKNGITVGHHIDILTDQSRASQSQTDTLQALLAISIVGEAKVASLDTRRDGPFAREVAKHFPNEKWQGGKPDDICVIVAIVINDGQTYKA